MTLPLPNNNGLRGNVATKLTCFDPTSGGQTSGSATFDQHATILPPLAAPPQFADSPPDEVLKIIKYLYSLSSNFRKR